MSVLIKGMEMPQRCMGCTLCYVGHMGDLMCEALRRPIKVDETGRDRFCPLIEVPTPHGELVDRGGLMDTYADRLTAVAERYSPDSSECGILSGAMKLLAIQPTVIEAEE